MSRYAKGSVVTYRRQDGQTTYSLRVRCAGERYLVRLGTEREGWNPERAAHELQVVTTLIEVGKWTPPVEVVDGPRTEDMTIASLIALMFDLRWAEWTSSTQQDCRWRAGHHIIPIIGEQRVSRFGEDEFMTYRAELARRAVAAEQAIESGRPLRDAKGRVVRPLSPTSRNKVLNLLAQALDLAVERRLVAYNVARGKGKRFKQHEPERTFAEPHEVHALLDAANLLDGAVLDPKVEAIRRRRAEGAKLREIAEEFGLTDAQQAFYLAQRAEQFTPKVGHRRAAIVAMAGCGLRAHELCMARVRDYDPVAKTLTVRKSKTDAGRRVIHVSDWVCEELDRYLAARGQPAADSPLFASQAGTMRDKDNVRERVVKPVREKADELLQERGHPRLPDKFTPHSLRRTWFTMMFEARIPARRIADQGGHRDPTTSLSIYNQSLKDRRHEDETEAFDALMRPPARGDRAQDEP